MVEIQMEDLKREMMTTPKLPISFAQFVKNPVAAVAFLSFH